MLYQLFKEGSIQSLDDPLRKYAPNFKINNPFSKYICMMLPLIADLITVLVVILH